MTVSRCQGDALSGAGQVPPRMATLQVNVAGGPSTSVPQLPPFRDSQPPPFKVCYLPRQVGTGMDPVSRIFHSTPVSPPPSCCFFKMPRSGMKAHPTEEGKVQRWEAWTTRGGPSLPLPSLLRPRPHRPSGASEGRNSPFHFPASFPSCLAHMLGLWSGCLPSRSAGQLPRGHPAPPPDRLHARGRA